MTSGGIFNLTCNRPALFRGLPSRSPGAVVIWVAYLRLHGHDLGTILKLAQAGLPVWALPGRWTPHSFVQQLTLQVPVSEHIYCLTVEDEWLSFFNFLSFDAVKPRDEFCDLGTELNVSGEFVLSYRSHCGGFDLREFSDRGRCTI